MKNVLVTVILTVYNRTEYLEEALKSVLHQTMTDYEIIIADDSGTRLAEPIYKRYASDPRIRYQANSENIGIVNSLKKAIQHSKGSLISVLNDDDSREKEFLDKLSKSLLENEECVLSFCDHWMMNGAGDLDKITTDRVTKEYKRDTLETGLIRDTHYLTVIAKAVPLAVASIFRKDAVDLNLLVSDVSGAYDYWLACLLSATGKPFYYVNERLSRYREHPQMETGRRFRNRYADIIYIYKNFLDRNMFQNHKAEIVKLYSFWIYRFGREQLYFGDFDMARKYFWKAIRIQPDYRIVLSIGLSYMPDFILKKIAFLK